MKTLMLKRLLKAISEEKNRHLWSTHDVFFAELAHPDFQTI
jgi:hypothetical protein